MLAPERPMSRAVTLAMLGAGALLLLGASSASAFTFNPPPWWQEGAAYVQSKGGTCERLASDPSFLAPGEIRDIRLCERQRPGGISDSCNGGATQGSSPSDSEGYSCKIYSASARRSLSRIPAQWFCERSTQTSDFGNPNESPDVGKRWALKAELPNGQLSPFPYSTLARCLSPKLFLGEASAANRLRSQPINSAVSKGIAVPVGCSARCEVSAKASAASATLGSGKRTIRAGRNGPLRVRLNTAGKLRLLEKRSVKIAVSRRFAGTRGKVVFVAKRQGGRISLRAAKKGSCVSDTGEAVGLVYTLACSGN